MWYDPGSVFDNISYVLLVEPSSFVLDEFLNSPLQFQVNRRLFYRLYHRGQNKASILKGNCPGRNSNL